MPGTERKMLRGMQQNVRDEIARIFSEFSLGDCTCSLDEKLPREKNRGNGAGDFCPRKDALKLQTDLEREMRAPIGIRV